MTMIMKFAVINIPYGFADHLYTFVNVVHVIVRVKYYQTACASFEPRINIEVKEICCVGAVRVKPRRNKYNFAHMGIWVLAQPAHQKAATTAMANEHGFGCNIVSFKFFTPSFVVWLPSIRNIRSLSGNVMNQK